MENVATIPAFADRIDDQWCCQAAPIEPWTGLFAWAATFAEARQGLARLAWTQLAADPANTVDAVRILCVTRKTFGAVALTLDP